MDGSRFDALTRTFTATRRGAGRTLLGGLAAVFVTGRSHPALAVCKEVGQNCDQDGDCCTGARCKNGQCKCKSGREECDGLCYRLDRDEEHCGGCTVACGEDETCCNGVCCDRKETCCDGVCVNLDTSRSNCGACGARCDVGERCSRGECERITIIHCADENDTKCGDECVDLQRNRRHCGACGNECAPGRRCCDGTCVDTAYSDDVNNCGGCGWRCPAGADRCTYLRCCFDDPDGGYHCTDPLRPCNACTNQERCCDGFCRVIVDDRQNCGACDRACDTDEICKNRTCVPCPPGRVVCGNACCLP